MPEIGKDVGLPVVGYLAKTAELFFGKRRMHHQLYRELVSNYHKIDLAVHLVTSVSGLAVGAPFRFVENADISFAVWSFYNSEKRQEKLFTLEEAEAISRIYEKFRLISTDSPGYAHVRGKEALAEIEDMLLADRLHRHLFKKMSAPGKGQFVDDLFSGKRRRNREFLSPIK